MGNCFYNLSSLKRIVSADAVNVEPADELYDCIPVTTEVASINSSENSCKICHLETCFCVYEDQIVREELARLKLVGAGKVGNFVYHLYECFVEEVFSSITEPGELKFFIYSVRVELENERLKARVLMNICIDVKVKPIKIEGGRVVEAQRKPWIFEFYDSVERTFWFTLNKGKRSGLRLIFSELHKKDSAKALDNNLKRSAIEHFSKHPRVIEWDSTCCKLFYF